MQNILEVTDKKRLEISPNLDTSIRKKLGQFFTPINVANFMASLFDELPEDIRLLDAGAGIGSLTSAFVHNVCSGVKKPKSIFVTAFEVDIELARILRQTLKNCELYAKKNKVDFNYRIIAKDYIQYSFKSLSSEKPNFNCAILNPPYAKLNANTATRRTLSNLGIETTNLYSGFVALAISQLEKEAQLIAITPRSFCNGTYFTPFRKFLFNNGTLKKIHLYDSRKKAFKDDTVLQENIIFSFIKGGKNKKIEISSCPHPESSDLVRNKISVKDVIHPNDESMFIRLTIDEKERKLAQRVLSLPFSLDDIGLTVSTGRVVDFRAKEYLKKKPSKMTMPLIYPAHFNNGFIKWPLENFKKYNALVDNMSTIKLKVPTGHYVLTKRFTAKEEKRRIVAVVYNLGKKISKNVGFENHLNYFHQNNKPLSLKLAKGLCLYLNSTAVDEYFRQFSGHTQVNAGDLRSLKYPSLEDLVCIGEQMKSKLPNQEEIDQIINVQIFDGII